MEIENWKIEEVNGYKPITTFYMDFSISEKFGVESIRDTYKKCFEEWKSDYKYMTELYLVLNWKIWRWFEENEEYSKVYDELWRQLDNWCMDNIKGEEFDYFYRWTD